MIELIQHQIYVKRLPTSNARETNSAVAVDRATIGSFSDFDETVPGPMLNT